jgi:hypothetical protein
MNDNRITLATAAAEVVSLLTLVAGEALLPVSTTARRGTTEDFALAVPPAVNAEDMAIVVEAKVRGGRMGDVVACLPSAFNLAGKGDLPGGGFIYAAIMPVHCRAAELPQTFCIILRPA